jgi:carboxylesterase type B
VWGNQWPPLVHMFDSNDWNLTATVQGFWTNFAATGNPNTGPTTPAMQWPAFATDTELNLQLDVPLRTNEFLLSGLCDMWDQVANSLNGAGTVSSAHKRFYKGLHK